MFTCTSGWLTVYAIQSGQFEPVGAQRRFRSTPGQIQLSIERVDTVGEDVCVVCDVETLDELDVVEEEELTLLLDAEVLELETELEREDDGELLEELVTELVELEVELELVVLLLGKVAM